MSNEEISLLMFFAAMTGFVLVVLMILRYAHHRLQSREMITAIERNQPLRARRAWRRTYVDDLRTGVLLMSFSVGLVGFFWVLGNRTLIALALIPLSLGAGYLINAQISKRHGNDANPEGLTGGTSSAGSDVLDREEVSLEPPAAREA